LLVETKLRGTVFCVWTIRSGMGAVSSRAVGGGDGQDLEGQLGRAAGLEGVALLEDRIDRGDMGPRLLDGGGLAGAANTSLGRGGF
jgi:hypothetical protein